MNRSENAHIAISASFYENVFLLTQIIPPSFEFRQHFKKNMFNKPNTAGFLYVSYYLSVIYDAKLFKRMVKWPLLCKKDEVAYRNQMKNFLSVLSRDNPDINFPTVLISHLTQAGGIKFLIIMWKVSQLALRAYIKKQFQEELLNVPCTSPMDNLTITYFNSVIAERLRIAKETHREAKRILDTASNFLKNEIELQNMYKSEIFDKIQNIKKLVSDMSVHPLVQEQLLNVEDSNIINIWKKNILKSLQYIRGRNEELNKLKELCKCLCKLISKIMLNSEVLDANKLPKINDNNCLLRTQGLYMNGSIAFSTLLSLVYLASIRMLHRVNVTDSSDLSQCLLQIENSCKRIKIMQALFIALNVKLSGIYLDEQRVFQKVTNGPISFDKDTLLPNRDMLLECSEISFDLDQRADDDYYHKTLCPSLIKGKHKHLFRRYKRMYCPKEWIMASSGFSNSSWNNMSGWLSPRACSFKSKPVTPNRKSVSSLHLLTSECSTGNILCTPSSIYERSILKKYHSISGHLTSSSVVNGKARKLFNSSVMTSLYIP